MCSDISNQSIGLSTTHAPIQCSTSTIRHTIFTSNYYTLNRLHVFHVHNISFAEPKCFSYGITLRMFVLIILYIFTYMAEKKTCYHIKIRQSFNTALNLAQKYLSIRLVFSLCLSHNFLFLYLFLSVVKFKWMIWFDGGICEFCSINFMGIKGNDQWIKKNAHRWNTAKVRKSHVILYQWSNVTRCPYHSWQKSQNQSTPIKQYWWQCRFFLLFHLIYVFICGRV